MNLRILLEAKRDVNKVSAKYDDASPGLGDEFLEELAAIYRKILQSPDRFPFYRMRGIKKAVRWLKLKRFPYLVVYRVVGDEVVVLAVSHGSRRPGYWKPRMNDPE